MKSFKQFLPEQFLVEKANTHLEHIEDRVLDEGSAGAREALYAIKGAHEFLRGNSDNSYNVTVKWDGAPAVIFGTNPENGRFFVGSKSVFNVNPKINYTKEDCYANHPSGLAEKLAEALKYLSKLNVKGVLQGDLMYTPGDLKSAVIDGEKMITFHPNAIVYAVPENTDLAKRIRASKIGIVIHTTYSGGKKLSDMKPSFGADARPYQNSRDVWIQDAYFKDESGTSTFTKRESQQLEKIIANAEASYNAGKGFMDEFSKMDKFVAELKIYINSQVRARQNITDPGKYVHGYIKFFADRYITKIEKKRMEGKNPSRMEENYREQMEIIRDKSRHLVAIVEFMKHITEAKELIVKKLNQAKSIGTFLLTKDGYKTTHPEGFVAIDRNQNAVKLVDRMGFSSANFDPNIIKGWEHK